MQQYAGVQEYRSSDICNSMLEFRSTGVQTFAAVCRSAGVLECRHLQQYAGVQEYWSADICIGMLECRSTGVQTFATACWSAGVLECRHLHRYAGVPRRRHQHLYAGVQEYWSADICLFRRLTLTPHSPFLILYPLFLITWMRRHLPFLQHSVVTAQPFLNP